MTTIEAEREGYSCPWCPVTIHDDGNCVPVARLQFERHLDTHFALGRAAS